MPLKIKFICPVGQKENPMEKEITVTVSEDTFEDKRTNALVDYVRYSVKIGEDEFDLFPQDESKRLLKFLFDKKEYFNDSSSHEEKLLCTSSNNGIVYKILLFGKTFVLNPKKADKELLDYIVENIV